MLSYALGKATANMLALAERTQKEPEVKRRLTKVPYGSTKAVACYGKPMVVTDLSMPNLPGLELCRRIRMKSQVPIIVLSVRGEEKTKVAALDCGADDYVTKPFSMNELLARVRAGLRRATMPQSDEGAQIKVGDFEIDVAERSVKVRGHEVRLTPKEFELLTYLARHPNKVTTHRALLVAVWGANSSEQPEYLRVFINHLRKKLEPEDGSVKYIVTEPWVGYRFEPGEE